MQLVALLAELYVPAVQLVQLVALLVELYVPAVQLVQVAALLVELYVPAVQAVHVRLVVVVPSDATAWPALHVVLFTHTVAELASLSQVPVAHVVQAEAPAALYEPAAHAEQIRSVVVEPGDEMNWPARQVFLLTQAVAGLSS